MEEKKDYSKSVFGNNIKKTSQKFANLYKKFFVKKFGDDSNVDYKIKFDDNFLLAKLFGCKNIIPSEEGENPKPIKDDKAVVIGNIRMGYGHYRIAIAFVSAIRALGYNPYWFDLSNFKDSTATKILKYQNKNYSFFSRLSQKSKLFDKLIYNPVTRNFYRNIESHAMDEKVAETAIPLYKYLPKEIPFIASHVFAAMSAVHSGMKYVINPIPDNWPIALHISEGSLQTVQTPSSYIGYKSFREMGKRKKMIPMPSNKIYYVGHYVDHEIVSNAIEDCDFRLKRIGERKEKRYLFSMGGAGAQREILAASIKHMLPYVKESTASLFVNIGDHAEVLKYILKKVPELKTYPYKVFAESYVDLEEFVTKNKSKKTSGIYFITNKNVFEAVYATNLLMRFCDCLVTKPSELAFYPLPKIIIDRVGGHEEAGAFTSSELGDGTYECVKIKEILSMLDHFHTDNNLIKNMCYHIKNNVRIGVYDGAYNVARMAILLHANKGVYKDFIMEEENALLNGSKKLTEKVKN